MKKHTSIKSKFSSAFSLVELLVVVAVIAVIAAIAIPNIANVVDQSQEGVQRKNAQSLVNTYNNYVAAMQQRDPDGYAALPPATIAQALSVLTDAGGVGTIVDGTDQPFGIGTLTDADLLTAAVIEAPEGTTVKTLGYRPQ